MEVFRSPEKDDVHVPGNIFQPNFLSWKIVFSVPAPPANKKLFASAIKTGGNQLFNEGLDKEAFKSAHKINSS